MQHKPVLKARGQTIRVNRSWRNGQQTDLGTTIISCFENVYMIEEDVEEELAHKSEDNNYDKEFVEIFAY